MSGRLNQSDVPNVDASTAWRAKKRRNGVVNDTLIFRRTRHYWGARQQLETMSKECKRVGDVVLLKLDANDEDAA